MRATMFMLPIVTTLLASCAMPISNPATNWKDGANYPAVVLGINFSNGHAISIAGDSVSYGSWKVSFGKTAPKATTVGYRQFRIDGLVCSNTLVGDTPCALVLIAGNAQLKDHCFFAGPGLHMMLQVVCPASVDFRP